MKWASRTSRKAMFSFAMFCFLVFAAFAHAGDKTQLAGNWNFDSDQSDDAQQKVQQAQQSSQRAGVGGGRQQGSGYPGGGNYPSGSGYPGTGGYPGAGGMGRGGMGTGGTGRGGMDTPGSEVSNQEWTQLAANPKYLNITQRDDQILITDSEYTRTLYPDGKKHKGTDENGSKTSTKTQWQGDELIAETKTYSGKLTDTFKVSSDGKQLIVISRYENPSLSQPLSIRRVYDLGSQTH